MPFTLISSFFSQTMCSLIKEHIVCEKKDEITVKGIAHKIQTYQVVGSYKNIAQKRKILNEKFDGFNLNIDLNISKKNKVITSLENTLKQLKNEEKNN